MTNQTHPQEAPELVERLRALLAKAKDAQHCLSLPGEPAYPIEQDRKASTQAALEKAAVNALPTLLTALELQSPSPGGEGPAAAMPGLPSREIKALRYALDHLNADTFGADELATFHEMATAILTPSHSGETGEVERLRGAIQHEINLLRRADSPWAIGIRKRLKGALKASPDDGGLS